MKANEFDWGHGFVPRVGAKNRLQIDRSLSPPDLFGEAAQLPWAIVDQQWAHTKPHLLDHMRDGGTRLLFDSQAWRYREPPTFEIAKFGNLPHAPTEPIEAAGTDLRDFVRRDIAAQARLGADAYLIPGFVPRTREDNVVPMTMSAIDHALAALSSVPPKPLVAFVGGHTKNLGAVEKLMTDLHGAVGGVYLQVTPVHPMRDSPAKLVDIARLLLGCKGHGVKVLGGRLAAAGTLLRSVGIDAVDGGLAEGEAFALNELVKARRPANSESKSKGQGPRLYAHQLGISMNCALYLKLVSIQQIGVHLIHRAPCCRFRPISEIGRHAGEHSLRCRVDEAMNLARLPEGVRPQQAMDLFRAQSSLLTAVNGILRSEGHPPLSTRHVDNFLTALERLLDRPAAA